MVRTSNFDMRRSLGLSIALHLGVLLLVLVWSYWRPYQPNVVQFDEVEVIDTETFDALVAQTLAGSSGEDELDAPSPELETDLPASNTTSGVVEAEAVDDIVEETPEEIIEEEVIVEEVEVEPEPVLPPPSPAIQPDNLPDPIFDPTDVAPPQPLPQVEEATVSGEAEPESEGQEQAVETTQIQAPPARDAAQLRDVAEVASVQAAESPQDAVETTVTEEPAPVVAEQAEVEVDATSEIRPEAEDDAPISAAPAVAIVPPSRPQTLVEPTPEPEAPAPVETPVEALAETPAPTPAPDEPAAEPVVAPTPAAANVITIPAPSARPASLQDAPIAQVQAPAPAPAPEAQTAPTPSEGVQNATDGSSEETNIDDLVASVVEDQSGSQSQGRGLSRVEEAALTQKIHNNWVKTSLIEKDNYQDLVVTVRFSTDAAGFLNEDIRLILPQNPSADHMIAYETARRAILDSMPLEMPVDIDPAGVIWTINFDPASESLGLN